MTQDDLKDIATQQIEILEQDMTRLEEMYQQALEQEQAQLDEVRVLEQEQAQLDEVSKMNSAFILCLFTAITDLTHDI